MSKAAWTPGPWRFNPYMGIDDKLLNEARAAGVPVFKFRHNDGSVNVSAGTDDESVNIAHVQCLSDFKRGQGHKAECETRDANAHLISAAPELYEALKAMVDRWEPDCIGTDRRMWEEACVALSKAGQP